MVLGGGGVLGAVQVGMLRALLDAGVRPDLVLGTSVGAMNGVALAAFPPAEVADRLYELWRSPDAARIFSVGAMGRLWTLAGTGTHAHSNLPLRRMLERHLHTLRIEELPVRFQCCAASIERSAERWFDSGPAVDAVLASAAVPGLLPPVVVDGEHYLDGGLVNSIPVGRAMELGARCIFVLQVGRMDQPLHPPQRPWEVALVAFEIARRHRYARDMAAIPTDTEVHVLPLGDGGPPRYTDWAALRHGYSGYRDFNRAASRIEATYQASRAYLRDVVGIGS